MSESSFSPHHFERRSTHCSNCIISCGCSWGCLRGDDWAEIERLRGIIRAAKVGLEIAQKWMTPNVGSWQLESDRKEIAYAMTRVLEIADNDGAANSVSLRAEKLLTWSIAAQTTHDEIIIRALLEQWVSEFEPAVCYRNGVVIGLCDAKAEIGSNPFIFNPLKE